MSSNKTDFLRFSAYSIKEYITRKLSEDTKFTDQIYEGSNLAILIDLVSYMYQCLMFQLNNAAAESMFSDTQIYENISRLINLIGYHPNGIKPSKALFYLENNIDNNEENISGIFIPKYSHVDTGLVDKHGKRIFYSFTEKSGFNITNDELQEYQLTNGKWKLYSETFIATGSDYEEFQTTIGSDVKNNKLCANNMIDVYVYDEFNGTYTQWERTDFEIFTNNNPSDITKFANIYNNKSKIFTVKLDENKNYIIKFGNGVVGKKLNSGDKIYIFYLDTNGVEGSISPESVSHELKITCNFDEDGIESELFNNVVLENVESENTVIHKDVKLYLGETSSTATPEESVEDIRKNAPQWFKMGQRLITSEDYEFYMKNIIPLQIVDCKVQNNWEYCSTFYKWLYDLGINGYNVQNNYRESDGKYYISENNFIKYDYKFADASDSNNIYIWTKMETGSVDLIKGNILDNMNKIKTLTSEVIFLKPIDVSFAITAAPEDVVMGYITSEDGEFDPYGESYIEITLNNNSLYSSSVIQQKIQDIFINFFHPTNNKLGGNLNYYNLLNNIYEINGIERVRTIYKPENDDQKIVIRDGLCFASWSSTYIDVGDDLEVSNSTRTLHDFQFPVLYTPNLKNRIKVIRKTISNINQLKY